MKRILTFLLAAGITVASLQSGAQSGQAKAVSDTANKETTQKKQPLFGISFSGYVKTEFIYDSRQIVGLRDNQFSLYPEPVKADASGNDINARGSTNILSIQTRLSGTITGPDALGAKTSAYLEGEFFGNANPTINVFRLRHAWLKLNWKRAELLMGQTWHPMFSPDCFPATVSFNTGAMFVVFSRNPQIRYTRNFGHFSIAGAVISQIDFTSTGPDGANSKYLRNSILPELDFQVQYLKKNESAGTEFLIGAGIDYLLLTPRLSNEVVIHKAYDTVENGIVIHQNAVTQTYKTNSQIGALSYNLMTKLKLRKVTLKAGGFYGENSYAFTMLGGYAVRSITDPLTGMADYAPLRTLAAWGEFSTNGKKWQPAIFGGFSKNLGIGEAVAGPYYARGSDIDYLYRISPRLILNIGKMRFAAEIEYTVAAYGKTTSEGYVSNSSEVGNLRGLLAGYYFF